MNDDIESARVPDDQVQAHPTLFSLSEYTDTPATLDRACREVGMNLLAAQSLYENGWLSFDPKAVSRLTGSQAAELRFLGALVAAGCDEMMLSRLLAGLKQPYAYRIERMYYNWREQTWQVLPSDSDLKETFARWVDDLGESAELDKLEALGERIARVIRDVRTWSAW